MDKQADAAELQALAQRIIDSGELGRSRTYAAILQYLVDCSINGETPKEAAIAVDVLGREADFDVGRDSIVRVHIYHLRNKLESYYRKHGARERLRLEIPKGQYALVTRPNEAADSTAADAASTPPSTESARASAWTPWLAGLVALLLALNLIGLYADGWAEQSPSPHAAVTNQAPWTDVLDDEAPILLVVGDYFIFGELDEAGNVERMVREFDINSPRDLATLFMLEPDMAERYYNLGLTYIPTGAATALMHVMPLLHAEESRLSIKMTSQLTAADLTRNHVIYLGYISGLGILRDLMFAASAFEVGETYDEVVHRAGGQRYLSESGIRNTGGEFSDYGMISTFPSPRGHRLILITGMRDAGLVNAAQEISNAGSLRELADRVGDDLEGGETGVAWEALYEVYGLDQTNFDASLEYVGTLRPGRIWSGE